MPPPAYEVSQQEFDRKVNEATLASLESTNDSDEQWEQWDEAKFQAAAQSHSGVEAGGSSTAVAANNFHTPTVDSTSFDMAVQPLQINKNRSKAVAPKAKERPSWLAEAGLADPSLSSTILESDSAPSASSSSAGGQSMRSSVLRPLDELSTDDVDEDTISPPPFTEVETLLPPPPMPAFHGIPSNPPSRLSSPPFPENSSLPVPAFHGNSSNPPSPLSSPVPTNAALPPLLSVPVVVSHHPSPPPQQRQSLPPPRRSAQRMGPRAYTTLYSNPPHIPAKNETNPSLPYMRFDPSVAYQKSRRDLPPSTIQQRQAPAYTSFYK
jgi:hypothetical protein